MRKWRVVFRNGAITKVKGTVFPSFVSQLRVIVSANNLSGAISQSIFSDTLAFRDITKDLQQKIRNVFPEKRVEKGGNRSRHGK